MSLAFVIVGLVLFALATFVAVVMVIGAITERDVDFLIPAYIYAMGAALILVEILPDVMEMLS